MQYSCKLVLKDHEGNAIKGEKNELTLKDLCSMALKAPLQEDAGKGVDHFMKMGDLLRKLHNAKDKFELTSEEVTLLKERIPKTIVVAMGPGQFAPQTVVIYSAIQALEGKDEAPTPKLVKRGK